MKTALVVLWALPATLLGLTVGLLGLATGGQGQRRGRVLEFCGGAVTGVLTHLPFMDGGVLAMTLGHVVLGIDANALEVCRRHELVHVRQFERWGPALIPAYLLCSLWLYLHGRDFYRDNPFERQAYEESDG